MRGYDDEFEQLEFRAQPFEERRLNRERSAGLQTFLPRERQGRAGDVGDTVGCGFAPGELAGTTAGDGDRGPWAEAACAGG